MLVKYKRYYLKSDAVLVDWSSTERFGGKHPERVLKAGVRVTMRHELLDGVEYVTLFTHSKGRVWSFTHHFHNGAWVWNMRTNDVCHKLVELRS